MKFIKQKYLTIIVSIVGGIIFGLVLTFGLNVYANHLTAIFSSNQLLVNYGAWFNRESASDKQVIITNTGDIGVGTTNPTQKLTVAGIIESTSGGIKFSDGSTMATNAHGSSTFSTSGTFTVPAGITAVWVSMVGGGGGGSGGSGVNGGAYSAGGGGGGASSIIFSQRVPVISGQNIAITIGAGGAGGAGNGGGGASTGGNGGASSFGNGASSFGNYISILGGCGGYADSSGSVGGTSTCSGSAYTINGISGSSGTYCGAACVTTGGNGGNSYFGAGGNGGYNNIGSNGVKGSGGGGGGGNGGTIVRSGGAGGAGFVLVEW